MKLSRGKIFWISGWFYDFTRVATIFIFIFLIINYFVFTLFIVSGASMDPNLKTGDVMFINRLQYIFSPIKRGDIIALYFPGEDEKKFVKRILGLPGESLAITNSQILINNNLLEEKYLYYGIKTYPEENLTLNQDEYYVMGDNREASSDSRVWGPLRKNYIIGKASFRLFNVEYIKNLFTR